MSGRETCLQAKYDGFAKSQKKPSLVIPAEAGIQLYQIVPACLDSGFHRSLFLHRILSRFPKNTFLCSLVFGFIGIVFVVPLTLLPLVALGITQMTPLSYSIFKGVWAGVVAGAMLWPIIMYALGNSMLTELK